MPIFKTLDSNFFENWSQEMAYALGYFAADGCMLKNHRGACFIEFHSVDRDLLEGLKSLLKSSHKISTRKPKPNCQTLYRLQIGSKKLYNDLCGLGFIPAKSKVLDFPLVPAKYTSDFIRGYFDGDGHVSISKYKRKGRIGKLSKTILCGFTSGSEKFLIKLFQTLRQHAQIKGGSLYHTNAYRLSFSVKDSKKLYEFLYAKVDTLFLKRKKEIFESYFNIMDR